MKILRKALWFLLYLLPAVLFFSYHPVIGLGANASMNFELSLPLIWLILFDFGSFILMIALFYHKKHDKSQPHRNSQSHSESQSTAANPWGPEFPGLTDRRFFLLALFPLYLTISIFWSANPLRGLLTAGVMWAVFFAVFSILYILPQTPRPRRLRLHVLAVMFVASVLVCKYCYAQSIMDVAGLSRDVTLLCPGCTYHSFGFPHPSGFAIEPQFMGNLLLAPALTALYLVVFRSRRSAAKLVDEATYLENTAQHKILHDKVRLPDFHWKRWQRIGMIILTLFLTTTLFFTFSRGAIYAYIVAVFVMLIFLLKRHTFRWSIITIPLASLLIALGLQGTFAAVGPTAETFVSGVTKSIHQLSLGIIDLRPKDVSQPVENSDLNCGNLVENNPTSVDKTDNSVDNSNKTVENNDNSVDKNQQPVQNPPEIVDNSSENCVKPVDKTDQTVENIATVVDKELEKHEEKSQAKADQQQEDTIFEGYVPESTNIRLSLNQTALWTWLSAPFRTGTFTIGLDCIHADRAECNISTKLTPSSVLFGVGLGGAGTAMNAKYPEKVTSPKEIVQHQGFSLLLETGLVGIALAIFGLLVAFAPQLFTRKFLDGKSATREDPAQSASNSPKFAHQGRSKSIPSSYTSQTVKAPQNVKNKPLTLKSTPPTTAKPLKAAPSPFWHHPALPLLLSLIIAYLVTLNFFSGLPNALQIYLMPPLLYLIFADNYSLEVEPAPSYKQA